MKVTLGWYNFLPSDTKSILVLDDNGDIVAVIKKSLELAGYAVTDYICYFWRLNIIELILTNTA